MNYEKDIEIDGEALDQEWLNQPRLMMKYAKHSARKRKILEESKQALDIAKAEADKSIRENPEAYGLAKITENAVFNAILNEVRYKEAYEYYLECKYEAEMAQGAVNAFEHRKSALENLVRLYGQQYFSGPRIPYEINREWEKAEQKKEINIKLHEGMMRKKQQKNDDD